MTSKIDAARETAIAALMELNPDASATTRANVVIDAYLAALGDERPEPVAWRGPIQFSPDQSGWKFAYSEKALANQGIYNPEPLYPASAVVALQQRVRELEDAIAPIIDLNVTDAELLRIRNRCEDVSGDIRIWARMLQAIVDSIRGVRTLTTEKGE